ncbi:MAG TPA: acyl-CoA thioester hydrolase/BAAT C-terminal domain-containing protein [Flexivirga sp.]|uniref:acyl-CoA thioester hydrolase/BAAT C-terminal domain-containing protein n=1 Tax=Flexivirga sp. TaxID=1962927 RepID=UPI002BB385F5|nr:acyl-CoA thioester hydrolase/BAAT C-terminal domain-containing protein [Flexivirga sp.]HWC21225.1 acyl-CoA thioester hydrolase/BAAT C-terminal domain-containing protein [Flexivirga sp.]
MREDTLRDPEGLLVIPEKHCGTGVLTIGGSSGRIDDDRARVLAAQGALAMSIRWFGGPGQHTGPRLIPLETFTRALDRIAPECDRLVIAGMSFGAEAALLTASYDERVDGCIGFAPSPVVWSFIDPDGTQVSHWSYDGKPVSAVPFDTSWQPDTDPPAYVGMYQQSLRLADPETVASATIPVERIGELLLVAGGDDQVWPSIDFAQRIVARRRDHGLDTVLSALPEAGHRTRLPGESPVTAGQSMRRGGTDETNRDLGRLAWPHVRHILRLPD